MPTKRLSAPAGLGLRFSTPDEGLRLPFRGEEEGASVTAGMGATLGGSLRTNLEVRLTEGLSDAYLGNQDSARNRTVELLVRVGKPL
ncbi:MAG: hypothetical protein ACWGSQ_02615 [Longimicrobiales bacterium]